MRIKEVETERYYDILSIKVKGFNQQIEILARSQQMKATPS